MDANHWRMYLGVATLSDIITESVLTLETLIDRDGPDVSNSSIEVRRILDSLLYKGIAEAWRLLPHAVTYAEAVFEGTQYCAPIDPTPSQHGAQSASASVQGRPASATSTELRRSQQAALSAAHAYVTAHAAMLSACVMSIRAMWYTMSWSAT
jgi:hypothetical protein